MAIDPVRLRAEFPAFDAYPGLAYLDSAATAQKPQCVLDAWREASVLRSANVHRGMYPLAEAATDAYEAARHAVAQFLHAPVGGIVFTKSATEAINLVAHSWGALHCAEGDIIAVTMLEHHSNIVPWFQLAERTGAEVRMVRIADDGTVDLEDLRGLLATKRVRMLATTAQSNVLGVRPPLEAMIAMAHAAGSVVLVDAAQAVAHERFDVEALACDFLTFSGHKLYGPSGIGVLYGRPALLAAMPPFLGGGMMIQEVTADGFVPADVPARFEAGTPPLAEAEALHAAIRWVSALPFAELRAHEQALIAGAYDMLTTIPGVRVLGPTDQEQWSSCLSFVVDGVHAHDIAALLGERRLCLRAGHHCAQPLHRRLGIAASARLSVAAYTTRDEVERLGPALREAISLLH